MTREEAYEPFYQFLREPSNSEKWKTLRGLVDNFVEETERDTLDRVLKIIDDVEHTEGLSKADEYGLLRMRVKELKGGQK